MDSGSSSSIKIESSGSLCKVSQLASGLVAFKLNVGDRRIGLKPLLKLDSVESFLSEAWFVGVPDSPFECAFSAETGAGFFQLSNHLSILALYFAISA